MELIKHRVAHYWSHRAEAFEAQRLREFDSEKRARWLAEFFRYLPQGRPLRVLDIGTGTGFFACLFAAEGHEATGIDLTPDMIEHAEHMAAVLGLDATFRIMDAENPDFEPESFDVLVTRNLTWTLPHVEKAYREWYRILKPGGVLINFDADYSAALEDEQQGGKKHELPENHAHKRLLQLIPILLAITFLSYGMMRIAGSDVVEQKMENTSGTVSQEMIDNARAELGLDKPFVVQYFTWLGNLLRGDMGTSYVSNKPVFSTFVSKLPATLLLTAVSILLTVLISIPLGIWSAVKQNTATDYVIRTASFIGNSLPNFFVSLLLMYFFAIRLGWFPVISGGVSLQSVALPALTLAIAMSAKYLRQVRATVLDELEKDYVLGARARGVKFSTTMIRSVMKASLVTIITLLTLSIGSLLGGTAIVESIFMWDGVGKLAVDAINMRDYPIIQAYVMWMAIIYVVINLITDLSYHFLDPRIRLGGIER